MTDTTTMPDVIAAWKIDPLLASPEIHGGWSDDHDHKTTRYVKATAIPVKPLVWDQDARFIRLDDTMIFSKGYDYDGLELCREEAHSVVGGYMIWPDSIASDVFNLYCTKDGAYWQDLSRDEAKAASTTHYLAQINATLADGFTAVMGDVT